MIPRIGLIDFDYPRWLAIAARHARRSAEAADLLHDALIDAIRAQRTDFSREENRRWFTGVLRNRGAMAARSAARRRGRETTVAQTRSSSNPRAISRMPTDTFLSSLPPSARRVATLVASGMAKQEIVQALRLTDTSFRQRLTTIRRAWKKLPDVTEKEKDLDSPVDPDRALGLMRRALLRHVRQSGGIGTHDPDGHLIAFEIPARPRKS